MSTLRVANLQSTAGTQTVTQDRLYRGAATAWVNFNGTGTVAIRDNYNVSSITDNGVGDYTVNFTTALANANYSGVITCGTTTQRCTGVTSQSTTQFRLFLNYSMNSSLMDESIVCVAIFGGY